MRSHSQPRTKGKAVFCLVASVFCMAAGHAAVVASAASAPQPMDLLEMSLDDLGKIKVTTVSRKSEEIFDAAAAIHVITQEDIRRSGVNSLPEALRMAPGLEVARANSRQWAISARGFNGTFANKLLVLMDGRTIYTPLFSGVFWEETDTVLEDIDRIEVIRGPGATLWGANAVNGVINIITKSAKETQGLLFSGGGGFEERGFGTLRYGGRLGTNAYYRVYTKFSDRDEFTLTDGHGASDNWWMSQQGFRVDWEPSEINHLTLQGDYYYGELGGTFRRHTLTPPRMISDSVRGKDEGLNVVGRWTHWFSADSELSLQTSYDRTDHDIISAGEVRDTFDLDAQHRFHLGERNEVLWGAGYRYSVDDIRPSVDLQMRDLNLGLQLFSAFVQDEVTLATDRLHLTLGTKLEHNDFTGFELQPSGRIAWTPTPHQTIWGAVSRAVRTPSRGERELQFYADAPRQLPPLPFATLFQGRGNPEVEDERLIAYEIGYRVKPHPRFLVDWTVFYHDYDQLRNAHRLPFEIRFTEANVPYVLVPLTADNELEGETYGSELSVTWQPIDSWRLQSGYTFLKVDVRSTIEGITPGTTEEDTNPQHQFFLRSEVDLGPNVEFGIGVRHISELSFFNIPSYTELDARLAWKPTKNCELALIGRNLLDPHHHEFAPPTISAPNVQVDRSVFAKLTLRF